MQDHLPELVFEQFPVFHEDVEESLDGWRLDLGTAIPAHGEDNGEQWQEDSLPEVNVHFFCCLLVHALVLQIEAQFLVIVVHYELDDLKAAESIVLSPFSGQFGQDLDDVIVILIQVEDRETALVQLFQDAVGLLLYHVILLLLKTPAHNRKDHLPPCLETGVVVAHEITETPDHELLHWEGLRSQENLLEWFEVVLLKTDEVLPLQKLCHDLFQEISSKKSHFLIPMPSEFDVVVPQFDPEDAEYLQTPG